MLIFSLRCSLTFILKCNFLLSFLTHYSFAAETQKPSQTQGARAENSTPKPLADAKSREYPPSFSNRAEVKKGKNDNAFDEWDSSKKKNQNDDL
jgi:hypothetical protein